MSRWPLVSLLVLTACPKKGAGVSAPSQPGAGCPPASMVYMATYVQPPEGEQGYTGWVLPLHDVKVDSVQGQPAFASIDEAVATAAGVPVKPSTIWLVPPGAPPCRATVGAYYAATIEGSTPNITYGVELAGCAAPKDAGELAVALASAEPPTACTVTAPRPVASRVGEHDQTGQWTPPTKETAIPAELAAHVPARECTAPACEKLWSVAATELAGKPVAYGAAVNWVTKTTGACPYKTEAWSGFFVPGPDGALVQVTDGQDHPLALTLLLSDASGRAILIAQGPGEYTTYELAGGGATVGRHLVWLVDEPDAYEAIDHLGPDCPTNN